MDMRYKLIIAFLLSTTLLKAQQSLLVDEISIAAKELAISALGDSILRGSNDSIRVNANNDFTARFKNLLQSPNTFDYAFDSLKNVSKLKSDDNLIRIYTWILPTDSGRHYQYFGFVQYRNSKLKTFKTTTLIDAAPDSTGFLKKTFKPDTWYGALYYKIITVKNNDQTYYTLLGWKGNTLLTTKKVIDILYIKNNNLLFGAPILQNDKKMQSRIVFEFNAQTSMLLHWDERNHKIIYDYLGPANEAGSKMPETYGATMIYDALNWKKGKWNYAHDIDIRNEEDSEKPGYTKSKKRNYYTPEK
jgi:hypothetical protein